MNQEDSEESIGKDLEDFCEMVLAKGTITSSVGTIPAEKLVETMKETSAELEYLLKQGEYTRANSYLETAQRFITNREGGIRRQFIALMKRKIDLLNKVKSDHR